MRDRHMVYFYIYIRVNYILRVGRVGVLSRRLEKRFLSHRRVGRIEMGGQWKIFYANICQY